MAGSGFGGDFFAEVLGQESNPLREFMGGMPARGPDPLGLGSQQGAQWFSALAPRQVGAAPTLDFWSPFQESGEGGLSRARAAAGLGPGAMAVAPAGTAPAKLQGPIAKAKAKAAAEAQAAAGGSGGGAASGELDASFQPNDPIFARAAEVAQEEGVDPVTFQRIVAVESRGNPNAYNRKSGAGGLTGLMPATAQSVGVTNMFDPEQALRGGAKYLRQMVDRYGGDYVKAVAAYNAGPGNVDQYGGVPPFEETQKYVRAIRGSTQPSTPAGGQAVAMPSNANEMPSPPPGVKPLRGITVAQYGEEGLATGAAEYICGVIAAKAFADSQGRNPSLREALDLARQIGVIDPARGMHGIESTVQLIRRLGGTASVGKVDKNQIIQELSAGRPVIVDTDAGSRGHYFVIEGYNPEDDTFDFGNSARALRASQGRSRYTLDQISSLGFGSPHAAIYAR